MSENSLLTRAGENILNVPDIRIAAVVPGIASWLVGNETHERPVNDVPAVKELYELSTTAVDVTVTKM